MIKLKSTIDGFAFTALHVEPQGKRRGGVILIQEIFGLDQYMEQDAARWAALGFEAIAPSMFDRQEVGFVAEHDEAGMQKGRQYASAVTPEQAMGDVQACADFLKPRGSVFLAGYCYGGWVGWLAAAKVRGLAAVSSYYGGRLKDDVALKLNCPIICHFGQKDGHIDAAAMVKLIGTAHPEVPVYVYANSGHGFNNDGRPGSDPKDAELARRRTLELFTANGAS